jgi:hypothetical protein
MIMKFVPGVAEVAEVGQADGFDGVGEGGLGLQLQEGDVE